MEDEQKDDTSENEEETTIKVKKLVKIIFVFVRLLAWSKKRQLITICKE